MRKSMSKHLTLSTYGDTKAEVLMTFSNFCWFERVKAEAAKRDGDEPLKCSKEDFEISIKLSSPTFASQYSTQGQFCFDKHGLYLTYEQAYVLFRSEQFVVEFMDKVADQYRKDTYVQDHQIEPTFEELVEEIGAAPPEEEVEEEEEEEVQIEEPAKTVKKTKIALVENQTVKRVKRL